MFNLSNTYAKQIDRTRLELQIKQQIKIHYEYCCIIDHPQLQPLRSQPTLCLLQSAQNWITVQALSANFLPISVCCFGKWSKKGIFKGVARAIVVLIQRMPVPTARFFHIDSWTHGQTNIFLPNIQEHYFCTINFPNAPKMIRCGLCNNRNVKLVSQIPGLLSIWKTFVYSHIYAFFIK